MHGLRVSSERDGMTSKERLFTTLQFGVTDKVPFLPLLREFAIRYAGFKYRDVLADTDKFIYAQLKCLQDFHTDAVWDYGSPAFFAESVGGQLILFDDDAPAERPPAPSEELLGKLKKIDLAQDAAAQRSLQLVTKLKKAVGPECPVIGYLPMPFRFASIARGIEQIMLDVILAPDMVRALQECYIPFGADFAEALITAGADMVWLTNPIANRSCISRKHFEELVHPYSKLLIQQFKKRGIKSIFHICGDWRDRLDLVVEEGVNCLSVDKGDMAEIKQAVGSKVCIMGNVDVTRVLLQGTSEEVAKETNNCLKAGAPGGGYILSGSCLVPRDVPAANVLAMAETCNKFDLRR